MKQDETHQQEANERDVQALVELTQKELGDGFEFNVYPQNVYRTISVTILKPEEWAKHLLLHGCPNWNTIAELSQEDDPMLDYEQSELDWDYCEDYGDCLEVLSETYDFDDDGQLEKLMSND